MQNRKFVVELSTLDEGGCAGGSVEWEFDTLYKALDFAGTFDMRDEYVNAVGRKYAGTTKRCACLSVCEWCDDEYVCCYDMRTYDRVKYLAEER